MKNLAILLGIILISMYMSRKHLNKKLSENFYLFEFTKTYTGFDNYPPEKVQKNLEKLVEKVLQPLRTFIDRPIIVTSGYRSEQVNEAIGGEDTSDHVKGFAADIQIKGVSNAEILKAIKHLNLPVKQVIDEQLFNSSGKLKQWVHIAYDPNNVKNEFLTARNSIDNLKTKYTYA